LTWKSRRPDVLDVPVGQAPREVAGVEQPVSEAVLERVGHELGGVQLGEVVVAIGHAGAGHVQFARHSVGNQPFVGIEQVDPGVLDRSAGRHEPFGRIEAGGVVVGDVVEFGAAVVVDQTGVGQKGAEFRNDLARKRFARGDAHAQGGKRAAFRFQVPQHTLQVRRHQVQAGHAVADESGHEAWGVEHGRGIDEDQRCAVEEAGEEFLRGRGESDCRFLSDHVGFVERPVRLDPSQPVDQLAVGNPDTFGRAGRAGRVHDVGQRLGAGAASRSGFGKIRKRCLRQVERELAVGADFDASEGGTRADDHFRIGVGEDLAAVGAGVGRVHRNVGCADPPGREETRQQGGVPIETDSDNIAGADPFGGQGVGQAAGASGELPVGAGPRSIDAGDPVGSAAGLIVEPLDEGRQTGGSGEGEVVLDADAVDLLPVHHGEVPDGSGVVLDHGQEQAPVVGEDPFDGGSAVQVGGEDGLHLQSVAVAGVGEFHLAARLGGRVLRRFVRDRLGECAETDAAGKRLVHLGVREVLVAHDHRHQFGAFRFLG
jgi:hypothetical protein